MQCNGGEVNLAGVEVVEESTVDGVGEVTDVNVARRVCSLFPVILEH